MPIATTAVKVSLSAIGKAVAQQAPGTAGTAVIGASVIGEIQAANVLGDQSKIYIPIYGEAGIDAGVVGYTAVAVVLAPRVSKDLLDAQNPHGYLWGKTHGEETVGGFPIFGFSASPDLGGESTGWV